MRVIFMLQIRKIKVLKHCDPFKTNFMGLNGKMAEYFLYKMKQKLPMCPFLLTFSSPLHGHTIYLS